MSELKLLLQGFYIFQLKDNGSSVNEYYVILRGKGSIMSQIREKNSKNQLINYVIQFFYTDLSKVSSKEKRKIILLDYTIYFSSFTLSSRGEGSFKSSKEKRK